MEDDIAAAKGQAPVYFEKVSLVPEGAWNDIDFIRAAGAPAEPDQMRRFRMDIQSTCRVIITFLRSDRKERDEFLLLIHKTADLGLRGPDYSLEGGISNLVDVKERLVNYAYNVRRVTLRRYAYVAFVIAVPAIVAGILIYSLSALSLYLPPPAQNIFPPLVSFIIAAFWIPAGASVGAWVEFALRVETLTYDRLLYFDPGRWEPRDRILIAVVVAFVLALFLGSGALQVGLGSILLNDFTTTRPYCSLVIGFVTGFAFPYVKDILYRLRPAERGP